MRSRLIFGVAALVCAPLCFSQEWEMGGAAGYGVYVNRTVTRDNLSGKAGFRHGMAASFVAGQNMFRRLSGEIRYTFRDSDLKLSSGGTNVRFAGDAHAVHYDLLLSPQPKGSASRVFVAFGGGVKVFRGTDKEQPLQPLGNLAALTRTREVKPLLSLGAGISKALGRRARLRLEFRDYITPFPKEVVAPNPSAKLSGWLHDIVPMAGLSVTF